MNFVGAKCCSQKKYKKFILTVIVLLLSCRAALSDIFTVSYLTDVKGRNTEQRQGLVVSGALSYAIEEINARSDILTGHELQFVWSDTMGDTINGTRDL